MPGDRTKRTSNSLQSHDGLLNLINAHAGASGSIIGTGISIEAADLAPIAGRVAIGMNEAPKIVSGLDYLVIQDVRALTKAWPFIEDGTSVILGRRCCDLARRTPGMLQRLRELDVYECTFTVDPDADAPHRIIYYNCGILTGALSFAVALGLAEVDLYGCDFCRREGQHYAYDASPMPTDPSEPIGDGLYTTPALRAMAAYIDNNAEVWSEEMKVINRSPISQIKAFEHGD